MAIVMMDSKVDEFVELVRQAMLAMNSAEIRFLETHSLDIAVDFAASNDDRSLMAME